MLAWGTQPEVPAMPYTNGTANRRDHTSMAAAPDTRLCATCRSVNSALPFALCFLP